jgi:hypothetical protein
MQAGAKMHIRKPIAILLAVLLLTTASLTSFLWWKGRQSRPSMDFLPEVQEQLTKELLSKAMNAPPYGGFKLEWKATSNGDVTTVVLVFKNEGDKALKNLVFSQITLGGIAPQESMPIEVSELQPGKNESVILHFQNVPWNRMGDINTIYQVGLNIYEAYEASDPKSGKKWTNDYKGIPINLDQESVRQREAARVKDKKE